MLVAIECKNGSKGVEASLKLSEYLHFSFLDSEIPEFAEIVGEMEDNICFSDSTVRNYLQIHSSLVSHHVAYQSVMNGTWLRLAIAQGFVARADKKVLFSIFDAANAVCIAPEIVIICKNQGDLKPSNRPEMHQYWDFACDAFCDWLGRHRVTFISLGEQAGFIEPAARNIVLERIALSQHEGCF